MEEKVVSEASVIADRFAEKIKARPELPIDPDDARKFALSILPYNPPAYFFDRLAAGLTFINEDRFRKELLEMKQIVQRETVEPRYVVYEEVPSSQDWIYHLLVNAGLPVAKADFDITDSDAWRSSEKDWRAALKAGGRDDWETLPYPFTIFSHLIPIDAEVLIVDDYAYTGIQLHDMLNAIPNDRIVVILLGATQYAIDGQVNAHPRARIITVEPPIQTMKDALGDEGFAFIEQLDEKLDPLNNNVNPADVLRWYWYKIPDSVSGIFTGEFKEIHPLIRAENFLPPYKQQSTYE